MSSYQGARLQTDHRSCVISWQNLNIETYLTMILSRSSSNSVDKEISLTPSLILADDLLAQAQIEMQTCSVRRQNKVADRSSHNRCGTAVATAASVEILAKENHHAFSSSKCFTKCVNFGLFGNNLPNASYLWAGHPSNKTTHSKAAPAASAWITRCWCCTGNAWLSTPPRSITWGWWSIRRECDPRLHFHGELRTISCTCQADGPAATPWSRASLHWRGDKDHPIFFVGFPLFPCFQSINQQAIPFLCAHSGAPIMHHSNGQYCNGLWMHYLSLKTYTLHLGQNVCF